MCKHLSVGAADDFIAFQRLQQHPACNLAIKIWLSWCSGCVLYSQHAFPLLPVLRGTCTAHSLHITQGSHSSLLPTWHPQQRHSTESCSPNIRNFHAEKGRNQNRTVTFFLNIPLYPTCIRCTKRDTKLHLSAILVNIQFEFLTEEFARILTWRPSQVNCLLIRGLGAHKAD